MQWRDRFWPTGVCKQAGPSKASSGQTLPRADPPPYTLLELLSETCGPQYRMHNSWVVLQMIKPHQTFINYLMTCSTQPPAAWGLMMSTPMTSLCYLTINKSDNCAWACHIPVTHLPHPAFKNAFLESVGEFGYFEHELLGRLVWGPDKGYTFLHYDCGSVDRFTVLRWAHLGLVQWKGHSFILRNKQRSHAYLVLATLKNRNCLHWYNNKKYQMKHKTSFYKLASNHPSYQTPFPLQWSYFFVILVIAHMRMEICTNLVSRLQGLVVRILLSSYILKETLLSSIINRGHCNFLCRLLNVLWCF